MNWKQKLAEQYGYKSFDDMGATERSMVEWIEQNVTTFQKVQINVTQSHTEFILATGEKYSDGREEWYRFPYWLKKVGDNSYELAMPEDLPLAIKLLAKPTE